MAFNSDFHTAEGRQGLGAFDAGLRAYMLRVYSWMMMALVITGAVAYAVVNTSLRSVFFHVAQLPDGHWTLAPTGLGMLSIFLPLVFVLVLSFGIQRLSRQTAQLLFVLYSVSMGLSLSNLLLAYTGVSVVRTFFITALLYGVMSLWGYVTRYSLARFGSFLMMGLVGLLIAGIVNLFFHSNFLSMGVSCVGVLIFTVFTAYDTQRIKLNYQGYLTYCTMEEAGKYSVYDALNMYLNFVNLFQFLLQFLGVRSNNSD